MRILLALITIVIFLLTCIAIFLLIEFIKLIISLIKRMVFIRRLKHVSNKNGAILTKYHGACNSFFKSFSGYDFGIQSQSGKKILIKFFPFFTDGKFVSIYWDERKNNMKINITHRFSLGVTYSEGRRRLKAPEGGPMVTLSGLSIKRKLNLDSNNEENNDNILNIIIYSAKTNQISFINNENKMIVVDNGVEYLDNSLFYSDKIILNKISEWLFD